MRASSSVEAKVGDLGQLFEYMSADHFSDGTINIWHKATAMPVERLPGHSPRTNSVSWSPTDPCLFASCGDDGKTKM